MNYKNQKRIEIKQFDSITHKEGTNDSFLQPINWKYYDEALASLSGNAFKLWLYLLRWVGKGYYDFSPVHLCEALNIGSCFVCSMNPVKVKEILGLNDSYVVDILLPIGYKDEVKKHNTRKDINDLVIRK